MIRQGQGLFQLKTLQAQHGKKTLRLGNARQGNDGLPVLYPVAQRLCLSICPYGLISQLTPCPEGRLVWRYACWPGWNALRRLCIVIGWLRSVV